MTTTTPKPVRVQCVVCQKPKYQHKMATLRVWEPKTPEREARSHIERMPWCWGCHYATRAKSPDIYAARAAAYAEMLMHDWDGETMKRCVECGERHPDVLYPYTVSSKVVGRRQRCIGCRDKNSVSLRLMEPPAENAFDVTTGWIERVTGKKLTQWRQAEHNAQCILMREMIGLQHHMPPHGGRPTEDINNTEQEKIWKTRIQQTITRYVPDANAWRAWHTGCVPSNNA